VTLSRIRTTTLNWRDIDVGDQVTPLEIPVTAAVIVAGAIASRDFMPVHHDPEFAKKQGSPNMFMNILTTNGLCVRLLTDWAGPEAMVTKLAIRLGVPSFPNDPLKFTGTVTGKSDVLLPCTSWGGAAAGTVVQAAMAVATGTANAVMCYRAFNERSGFRFGGATARPTGDAPLFMANYAPFGLPTPAAWVALHAQRYMSTYGVTNEDFDRISVVDRAHAARNPDAWFYERPITLEDHQKSRWS
jgi:acyl dehydratase